MNATKITVDVHLGEEVMEISVGEGTQTFKWLASAVALRRGPKNAIVVLAFRNSEGELLNPLDKIKEHLASGSILTVVAEYSSSIPIDEYGDPTLNEWMQAAYVHSTFGGQWHSEAASWRNKLKEAVTDEIESSSATETFVQIGDFSEADLESAFVLDWEKIRVPHYRHKAGANNEELNKIRATLRAHYSMLCNLFIYYAGYGQVGHRYGMTMEDFAHFLHMTQSIPFAQKVTPHVHVDKYRGKQQTQDTTTTGSAARTSTASSASVADPPTGKKKNQKTYEYLFLSSVTTASTPLGLGPVSSSPFIPTSHSGVPALFPLMSRYEFIESLLNLLVYKTKVSKRAEKLAAAAENYEGAAAAELSDDEPETEADAVDWNDSKGTSSTSSRTDAKAYTPPASSTVDRRRSSAHGTADAKKRHGSVSASNAAAAAAAPPSAAEVANKSILQQLHADLETFLTTNVADFWAHLKATSLLYCSPDPAINHEVKMIVYNLYQIIKQAFLAYAKIDPQRGPSISEGEMKLMMEECSLLDVSNTEHADMFLKSVYATLTPAPIVMKAPFGCGWEGIMSSSMVNAANAAANDRRGGSSRGHSRGTTGGGISSAAAALAMPGDPKKDPNAPMGEDTPIPVRLGVEKHQHAKWSMLPQLCFAEFLETVMKLSVCTIDARADVPSKIKLALNFIGELQSYGRK